MKSKNNSPCTDKMLTSAQPNVTICIARIRELRNALKTVNAVFQGGKFLADKNFLLGAYTAHSVVRERAIEWEDALIKHGGLLLIGGKHL